jgi:3-methylfumaryl-CoA hydratase
MAAAVAEAPVGGFDDWIGRGSTRVDTLSPRLIAQYRATLPDLAEGEVPLGLFWTLAPDAYPPADLGRDGHPRLGLELPPLPLKRRMWAGGEIAFRGAFRAGDEVVRDSRIERIAEKTGSTGPLIFVSVRHDYSVGGAVVLSERQDLVYREDPAAGAPPVVYPDAPELGPPVAALPLLADQLRLFRFSAMTFNGHRIHYDADYARQVEGYAGLVVHGPLQAVAMMVLASRVLGRVPERFSYRGLSPLTLGQEAVVEAHGEEGGLALRVRRTGGPVTMAGQAG